MDKVSYKVKLRIVKLLNVIWMTIPLIMWCLYNCPHIIDAANVNNIIVLIVLLFVIFYIVYGKIYEGFLISTLRISEMIYSQCIALIMANAFLYIALCLLANQLITKSSLAIVIVCQFMISIMWCTLAHIWYYKNFPPKKTAIIYDHEQNVNELINSYGLGKKFSVCSIVTTEKCIEGGFQVLNGIETIFLCGVHSHERNKILKYCVEQDITAYVLPRIGDVIMGGAKKMHLFHLPFLRIGRYNPSIEYLLIKRILDVSISVTALIVLSPLMVIVAIVIKVTDGGPVFYKQKRLTKNGKKFYVLKFRSMRQDAEKDGVARLSTGDLDTRVTPIGRVIRKVRIDELPQLLNILEGSMSLVGPRPERPEIAEQYEKTLPEFSLRLQAKAGLTGYAQVYGKYNTTPYDKLQMDLMYISNPSICEDLRIIFATIKILFMPESTEGVIESGVKGESEI